MYPFTDNDMPVFKEKSSEVFLALMWNALDTNFFPRQLVMESAI